MTIRPVWGSRVTLPFAAPGQYASHADAHGPAGHHTGIDFGGRIGTLNGRRIRALLPGKVVISEYNDTMGNWVGVYNAHHDLLLTYWHMSQRLVKVGDVVTFKQHLGRVGSTGNSTGPHLHLQANRGVAFNYSGHINPGPWVRTN